MATVSHQYYICVGDSVSKAFSADEVQRLYKAGRIPCDAMLSRDGKRWTPISDLIKVKTTSLDVTPRRISAPSANCRAEDYVTEVAECGCGWKQQVETRREHIGAITHCPNCGRLVAVSQLANPNEAKQNLHIDSATDATANPIKFVGWEVEFGPGDIRQFESTKQIRGLILKGQITRWNPVRKHEPMPKQIKGEKDDAFKERLKDWRHVREWHPLGEVTSYLEVKDLYQPLLCHTLTGARISLSLVAILTIGFAVLYTAVSWWLIIKGQIPPDVPQEMASKWGPIAASAVTCLFLSVTVAIFFGIPGAVLGGAIGFVIGLIRLPFLPKPPFDGYPDSRAEKAAESVVA
jgi:hypothetical protein